MHRCEAFTSRGGRCRRQATAYARVGRDREVLLCPEHLRHHAEGRLRLRLQRSPRCPV